MADIPTAGHFSWPVRDVALMIGLAVVTVIVLSRQISQSGFRDGDAAAHAMDGVLIHDWVAAGPTAWRNPMKFAEEQYAHYPSLGIGRHYPPGFAVVEALFFAIGGISLETARACVIFFGVAAVMGAYVFARPIWGRTAGALTGIAVLTMPSTVRWGRDVMLEVPTLAAMIWTGVAFGWWMRRQTWPRMIVLILSLFAAISVKQTAIVLVGAAAMCLVIGTWRRLVNLKHVCAFIVAATLLAGTTVLTLSDHAAKLLRGDATYPDFWSWNVLTGYVTILPRESGYWVCVLALFGIVFSVPSLRRRANDRHAETSDLEREIRSKAGVSSADLNESARRSRGLMSTLLFAWFAVCYVMLTLADYKFDRYVYVGLFPIATWAAIAAGRLIEWIPEVRWRPAAAGIAALLSCFEAWATPSEQRPNYGPVAAQHRAQIENHVVLFSGLRDGDFVFAVRQHIPWRRAMVIRGSKLLYACSGRPDLDFRSHVTSGEDVTQMMRRFAFRYVFVERENKLGLTEDAWLREFLSNGGEYRLLAEHPLKTSDGRSCRNVTLDVHELTHRRERLVDSLELSLPRDRRAIRAEFSQELR